MSEITNINGIQARDGALRQSIDNLRSTVLGNTIKPLTVHEDGTYTAIPNSGTYGYSPITVDTTPRLPDGYEQLDYVICPQSGQAGFEITGYTPIQYDIQECKTSPYSLPTGYDEAHFAGTRNNHNTFYQLYYSSNGRIETYMTNTGINAILPSRTAVVNGEYISRIEINKTLSDSTCIGYSTVNECAFTGAIYYYKIWRLTNDSENTLIYDFVPAKRLSDNKVGMYEKVNDVFYPSTTGTDFEAPTTE